jgi:hypothetical protein
VGGRSDARMQILLRNELQQERAWLARIWMEKSR